MTISLTQLHRFIVDHFNLDELRTLCFHLGIHYDELPGSTLSAKTRELILALGRRHRFEQLLAYLQKNRSESFDVNIDSFTLKSLYAALPSFRDQADTVKIAPLSPVAQLFFNLALIVLLTVLLRDLVTNWVPCVRSGASGSSLSVALLLFFHLFWRFLRPGLNGGGGSIDAGIFEIPLGSIAALFEKLHPRPASLSNKALCLSFGVSCLIGIWVFDLSPLPSPYRQLDETPIIQSFSIQYLDGPNVSLKPGEVVEILANEQVLVEANTLQQAGLPCTWSAVNGRLQPTKGCSILYNAPFDKNQDTLAVLIQSSCMNRQAYAGLHIKVIQSRSSP